MEILTLKAYARGYRGCLIDEAGYLFFQYTRNGKLRRLKSYPASDFADHDHFIAMMTKFITPTTFFRPPIPIHELSLPELDRVHRTTQNKAPEPLMP